MNPLLETRDLLMFLAVTESQSFTKAGKSMGISQSAVSRHIQHLEERLGITLLARNTRSITPTPSGEWLRQEAVRLTGELVHLERRISLIDKGKRELRIGLSDSLCLSHLPGLFGGKKHDPKLLVWHVSDGDDAALLKKLENKGLDVAVLTKPNRLSREVEVARSIADAFCLVLPLGTPFQSLEKLDTTGWLLPPSRSWLGEQLHHWLVERGLRVTASMRLQNFDQMIALVAQGFGKALVPKRALAAHRCRAKCLVITPGETFTRQILVLVRQHRAAEPEIQSFLASILFGRDSLVESKRNERPASKV